MRPVSRARGQSVGAPYACETSSPVRHATDERRGESTVNFLLAIMIGWGTVVLFLPPSILMFRNPPPENFVFWVVLRFVSALDLALFDCVAAVLAVRERRFLAAFFFLASFAFAVVVAAGVTQWVFAFPYPFGLSGVLGRGTATSFFR